MRRSFFVCGLLLFLATRSFAFEGALFKPLTAAAFEPRVGSFYQFGARKLRLDIGASIDFAELYKSDSAEWRMAADFFTYTRLRSQNHFKFPVETSDYYFGVNTTFNANMFGTGFTGRIRLAHISSHLVDGYSTDGVFWKKPFVYSREFFDVAIAKQFGDFRPYLGMNFLFSTQPRDNGAFAPQIGVDYEKELAAHLNLIAGIDSRITEVKSKFRTSNSAQIGLLFKPVEHAGISLNGFFYDGRSMHGMFYRERDSYAGFGFQVHFY